MKVMELLEELEEMVEKGNSLPFSSKALVNPVDFAEIVGELKVAFPVELMEAKKIVEERKRILFEAQAEADRLKESVEKKLRERIQNDQIVKEAEKEAERLITQAQNHSKEMRTGAQHYVDKILYNLQLNIKELSDQTKLINEQLEENRKALKGTK